MSTQETEHKCSVDKCFSSCISCATVRRAKLAGMKEVGEVVAPVVEAVKEVSRRIWIGSGEDFHPAVTN